MEQLGIYAAVRNRARVLANVVVSPVQLAGFGHRGTRAGSLANAHVDQATEHPLRRKACGTHADRSRTARHPITRIFKRLHAASRSGRPFGIRFTGKGARRTGSRIDEPCRRRGPESSWGAPLDKIEFSRPRAGFFTDSAGIPGAVSNWVSGYR